MRIKGIELLPPIPPEANKLTGNVIDAAIYVHRALGPGLLESVYERALAEEFRYRGIRFRRQVEIDLSYREVMLECGLRLDFLVEEVVILELKAVELVLPVHKAQVASYLRLTKLPLGLLLNFNVPVLREGVHRVVNPHFHPSLESRQNPEISLSSESLGLRVEQPEGETHA